MDLRNVTTFPFPRCQPPRQQHDRVVASFHRALTQGQLATIAKNLDMSRMIVENSNEGSNKNEMKASLPKKSAQSVRLVTKRTTRRNGVGKTLKPSSSPKNLKKDNSKSEETTMSQDDSNNRPTTSILKNSKKLEVPRVHFNEKLRVRQYIISDPSTIYYTLYITIYTLLIT